MKRHHRKIPRKILNFVIAGVFLVTAALAAKVGTVEAHNDEIHVSYTCDAFQMGVDFFGGGATGTPRRAIVTKNGAVVGTFDFTGLIDVANFYTDSGSLPTSIAVIYEVKLYQQDGLENFTILVDTDLLVVDRANTCTATPANSPTDTETPTGTPTVTPSPSNSPTDTPTATHTQFSTSTATHTPVASATSSNTPVGTSTASVTPGRVSSATPTATQLVTPGPTPTPTNTEPGSTVTPNKTPGTTPTATATTKASVTPTPQIEPGKVYLTLSFECQNNGLVKVHVFLGGKIVFHLNGHDLSESGEINLTPGVYEWSATYNHDDVMIGPGSQGTIDTSQICPATATPAVTATPSPSKTPETGKPPKPSGSGVPLGFVGFVGFVLLIAALLGGGLFLLSRKTKAAA